MLPKEEPTDSESVYGSGEGPDARYVTLISSDGHEFIVKREHALLSGTIRDMLYDANVVRFREIPSYVLEQVCMYFAHRFRHMNSSEIPEFPIPPEIAFEVLMAANFLDC